MTRFALAASLFVLFAVAACGAAPIAPTPSPSANPTTPSVPPSAVPPSEAPASEAPPVATPRPSVAPAPASPEPSPADFTPSEQYLLDGVERGTTGCQPAGGAEDLPGDAIAGIECSSDNPAVARIGFYLFAGEDDMIDAYVARMNTEGVELESGSCRDGEHEAAYIPWEGEEIAPDRNGCFINDDGYANYRATLSGSNVYIGILGRGANMVALEDFAWIGSRDTPGHPTLWADPR